MCGPRACGAVRVEEGKRKKRMRAGGGRARVVAVRSAAEKGVRFSKEGKLVLTDGCRTGLHGGG